MRKRSIDDLEKTFNLKKKKQSSKPPETPPAPLDPTFKGVCDVCKKEKGNLKEVGHRNICGACRYEHAMQAKKDKDAQFRRTWVRIQMVHETPLAMQGFQRLCVIMDDTPPAGLMDALLSENADADPWVNFMWKFLCEHDQGLALLDKDMLK